MVKADLIDLSTAANDWTYSSLWNLRFGRLSGFNGSNNLNRTTELVKTLLNTAFVNSAEGKAEGEKVLSLKLDVENAVQTEIDIWQNEGHIYADYIFDSAEENGYLGFFCRNGGKMPL